MLDTANIKFTTWRDYEEIIKILNGRFKSRHESVRDGIAVDLRKEIKNDWPWIHKIKVNNKGKYRGTEVLIDFSYPRFFNSSNTKLVNNERDYQKVNAKLFEFAKYITLDDELQKDNFEFIRIDIAQQYEANFEDHYNIFKFLQNLLTKYVGKGTKETKAFLEVNYGIKNQDYTKGFRYKKSKYCLTVYNKTAQMNPEEYIPGLMSLLRIEQSFTPSMLGVKHLYFKDVDMNYFREKYKERASQLDCDNLSKGLNETYEELKEEVTQIVKNGKIREDLRFLDGSILDEKIVCNIIQHMSLDKSERMRYRYKAIAKETLRKKGEIWRSFVDNFDKLEELVFQMCCKNIEIKLTERGIEVLKNSNQT